MLLKECNICHTIKPITQFYKEPNNIDGYRNKCIACSLLYMAEYRAKRKEQGIKWQPKRKRLNRVRDLRDITHYNNYFKGTIGG